MIVIRNRDHAFAHTARAGSATLKPGMVVKFSGVTANGTPEVIAATLADLDDSTVQKGLVFWRNPENTTVDFLIDPAGGGTLTPIGETIPEDAQVAVFTGKIVVAYHKSVLPAALQPGTASPLAKVAFDPANGFPDIYNSAGVDGTENKFGFIERFDGPEVTMVLSF